jgi:hypothetical protein
MQQSDYWYADSLFFNRLLRNSVQAGHNSFTIDLTEWPQMHYVGAWLEGAEVKFIGDMGDWFGLKCKNVQYTLDGTTMNFAGDSVRNSEFTITSTNDVGHRSQSSTFKVSKVTGNLGHEGANCIFHIGEVNDTTWTAETPLVLGRNTYIIESIGEMQLLGESTYKSHNLDTARKMAGMTDQPVAYIKPDGAERWLR